MLIVGAHAVAADWHRRSRDLDVKTMLVDTDPYNVTRSVALGLPARRLSVLTEEATHELDLRGIGRILAFTSNDEVNALASGRFARVFGRRETFQLAPGERRPVGSLPQELLGRIIGIDGLDYGTLDERARQGWRVRPAPAGGSIAATTEGGNFLPMARVFEGQLSFICKQRPGSDAGHGDRVGLSFGAARPRSRCATEHRALMGEQQHLFVYGTLRPGDVRWPFLEPFVADAGVADTVGGRVVRHRARLSGCGVRRRGRGRRPQLPAPQ